MYVCRYVSHVCIQPSHRSHRVRVWDSDPLLGNGLSSPLNFRSFVDSGLESLCQSTDSRFNKDMVGVATDAVVNLSGMIQGIVMSWMRLIVNW